jgi:hypothetical protein
MNLRTEPLYRNRWKMLAGLLLVSAALGPRAFAVIPPAEKILPPDTLFVMTAPDWARLREASDKSPQSRFWNDPAMKPFRDKFMAKWTEEFVQPLERDLGVKFDDYSTLLQGQVTLAVTQEGWEGKEKDDGKPAVLLLLDAKDKSSLLKTNLLTLRKKWSAAGKPIKTEKIRDVEFSVVPLTTNDIPATLRKFFPQPQDVEELGEAAAPQSANELVIGQYESLLIVSSSLKAAEKVVLRIAGNGAATLAEQGDFDTCRSLVFRDAPFYGWLNTRTVVELIAKAVAAAQNPEAPSPLPIPDFGKILSATGLNGLKAVAFSYRDLGEGRLVEFFLHVPEASRTGLMKLLAVESKEGNPPAFIPADVTKFARWRLDGTKAIATIEKVVNEFAPSTWNYILDNANEAMRVDDPEFDIRKNIFANLGDDLISLEKAPRGQTLAELASGPALFLISSPNPDKLAASLRGVFVIMSSQGGTPQSREFLGRKIYSFKLPGALAGSASALNYVASGGYVAFSTDDAMLEEYLRSSDGQPKALRDTTGFADAVAKLGGAGNGWLSYENQSESVRLLMDLLSRSAANTNKNELGKVIASAIPFAPPEKTLKEWVDFSLLPSYDKVAKYFGFSVAGGSTSGNGISIKYYAPTPAELLKK